MLFCLSKLHPTRPEPTFILGRDLDAIIPFSVLFGEFFLGPEPTLILGRDLDAIIPISVLFGEFFLGSLGYLNVL